MADQFDIRVAFSSSRVIGGAIRFFTGGEVNHALLLCYDPLFGTTVALGANPNGFTPQRLASFAGHIVHVYRPVDIDVAAGLRHMVGEGILDMPYDFAGLLGMTVVEAELHIKDRIVSNPGLTPHHIFCSEAVAKIIRSSPLIGAAETDAIVLPGVPAGSVDPAELDAAVAASAHFRLETF